MILGKPQMKPKDQRTTYEALEAALNEIIPQFVEACKKSEGEGIYMHQDAFAAQLDIDEILLLGMAIKFAGHHGKEVTVTPKPMPEQSELSENGKKGDELILNK